MFNSLAAYLLGVGVSEPQSPDENDSSTDDMRLTSVEVDDWLLVDKELPSDSDGSPDSPTTRLTDSEGEQRSSPPPPPPPQAKHKHNGRAKKQPVKPRSPSSSPSRPVNVMEESWFLTPPPCFTSQGPGELVTGPLENLLIEHPSMSVYQHSSRYSTLESLELTDEATLSDEANGDLSESDQGNTGNRGNSGNRGNESRRDRVDARAARAASINRVQQREEIKSGKKVCKARQPLKRGPLERNNKAREVNARNARRRRQDHAQAQRNSRANNNRKCC